MSNHTHIYPPPATQSYLHTCKHLSLYTHTRFYRLTLFQCKNTTHYITFLPFHIHCTQHKLLHNHAFNPTCLYKCKIMHAQTITAHACLVTNSMQTLICYETIQYSTFQQCSKESTVIKTNSSDKNLSQLCKTNNHTYSDCVLWYNSKLTTYTYTQPVPITIQFTHMVAYTTWPASTIDALLIHLTHVEGRYHYFLTLYTYIKSHPK